MGGKSSTSTQQVSIPPEVLARYSAANDAASTAASQPFQQYSTDPAAFVAQTNATQNAGIAGANTAAGQAQPYFQTAQDQLGHAQTEGQGYIDAATGQLVGAQQSAQPYLGAAEGNITGAQNVGNGLAGASLNTLSGAQNVGSGLAGASLGTLSDAQNVGSGLAGASLGSLQAANDTAAPLNSAAESAYTGAYANAQPYNAASGSLIAGGLGAASPLNQTAGAGYSSALASSQPYNAAATGLAAASAGAVDPSQVNSQAINQYLSPYLQNVLGGTAAQLNQDNQKAMSGQTGSAISQGAFGGDRAGVAAANLAGQQKLANAQIYSGILNSGYNNALGAAQQQQGVSLGAAQANRAALAGASSQLAAIGNQNYTQGTGTAAQQAALGQQEYGQGLGAASAVQGLGNQVFGQGNTTGASQAALGNQVFGQGLATSQQQAALGQQQFGQGLAAAQQQAATGQQLFGQGLSASQQQGNIGQQQFGQGITAAQAQAALGNQDYTMGANTSAQLAGLGNQNYTMGANTSAATAGLGVGAQSAAEQGAQGQLSAGQVAQQTAQGGNTALYNQFLQQQSYPFQTAQFLANVAEGTGSLSGSTTTTTQPGGFFSDERLKEDIQKIGETFDKQPIYSYRYKGDHRTQIGLIAQEVEKKHPDAVGSEAGYRTVDYKKATDDAADRGKFAGGGAPMLPGLSGEDMATLLAAQQQMYSPFAQQGGLYGGQTGGMPRGGSSYVPQGNLPVSHLTVAGGLPGQKSGLAAASDASNIAVKAAPYAQKGLGWLKGKFADNDDAANDDDGEARGGLIRAKRYASGGMPYDEQTGLEIPDETPSAKLATPGDLPGQKSGMSDVKDGAATALDIAKIAAMFMNRGGRAGFADGGLADDNVVDFASPDSVGGGDQNGVKISLADMLAKASPAWKAAVARDSAPPAVHHIRSGLAAASANPGSPMDVQTAPPPADIGTLAPTPSANADPQPGPDAVTPYNPSMGDRIGSGAHSLMDSLASGPVGDYASGLKHGSVQNWAPLLAAIGAAGTAQTVHPGVALAAGLGAGAQSYMGTKKALADVAQTQSQTGQTQAHTTTAQQGNAINYYKLAQAGIIKADPSGPIVDPATGTHYVSTQAPTPGIAGAPQPAAPQFRYLGPAGQAALPQSSHQYVTDSPALGITPNQGNIDTSNHIIHDAYPAASDAQSALSLLNEQAGAILSTAKGGVLSQGALAPVFQPYVEKWNSLVGDAGHPELQISGLGDAQIAHKLQVGQAVAQTSSSGQHAYQALNDVAAATANNALDPHAAAVLMAQNAVQATKTIDQRNALEEAKKYAPNGNYEAQDILTAFDHDNPPTVYNAMRDRVAGIYESPAYAKVHAALANPGSDRYKDQVKVLDDYGAQHGIPHFSRVFTGG